jgi:hypothetical protein
LARVLIHVPEPTSIWSISTAPTPTAYAQPTDGRTPTCPGRMVKPSTLPKGL